MRGIVILALVAHDVDLYQIYTATIHNFTKNRRPALLLVRARSIPQQRLS